MTEAYAALRTEKPCKCSVFVTLRGAPERREALRGVAQPLGLGQRLELLERVVLDLPDPLTGDVERAADLLERVGPLAGQPEAHLDHLALALGQGGQGAA